jgi:predicted methyltransferase
MKVREKAMRFAAPFIAALSLSLAAPLAAQSADPALEQVLADPRRDADRVRDAFRHPDETLAFFDVRPGMTVVDFMPAGGWFTRVIVPYLGDGGTYIGLNPNVGESGGPGFFNGMRNSAANFPGQARSWVGAGGAAVVGGNVGDEALAAHAGKADRFLIFREMHNIRRFGWLHDTLVAARTLLKDDGLLGIEQHRAAPGQPMSYVLGDNGYQREADVIALLSAYGFELVARSEINANPADPANWERGVWSLPPSFNGAPEGSAERARRAEIGESDRMTLLFRKRP